MWVLLRQDPAGFPLKTMTNAFKTIALMGNFDDARIRETICSIAGKIAGQQIAVRVSDRWDTAELPGSVVKTAASEVTQSADLIIAVGGDGSMLFAARAAATAGIPVLGINRGRLGFLADVSPSDHLEALDAILGGEYECEERMLLKSEIVAKDGQRECGIALNDVVVKRQYTGRMLEFQTHVDGRYVNTHGGDGFIVATPTGSTAYALSCGGPIVTPGLDAVVLAPICPHTLSDRPIVIPAASTTEVSVHEHQNDVAEVSCDGEVAGQLAPGEKLRISVARARVELIHPRGYDYYEILRNKLHWGRGNRKTTL